MRISLTVFIFFFFLNCSKVNKIEITSDDLKKEGTIFLKKKEITTREDNISLISKVFPINSKKKKVFTNDNFNFLKKKNLFNNNKKNSYKKNILVTEKNIFSIDDKSNFVILTHDFRISKKIQIHKKDKFKDYLLKFSLTENENSIFFLDNLGGVFSYDVKQNIFLWKNNFQIPFFSNILTYKNNVYAVNSNGKIFSFVARTGKINWTLETGSQDIKSHNGYKIAISSDRLFFTNDMGEINCIDLIKKKFLWSLPIDNLSNSKSFEVSNIVTENNDLYLSSSYGSLIKINLLNGQLLWSKSSVSILDPIINYKTIATMNSNGLLSIYDKKNGKALYKKNIFDILNNNKIKKKDIKINNSFGSYDKFFFTSTNGFFFLMNFNDLNSIKYKKISKKINSNIKLTKKNIYFVGDNNYLYNLK